MDTVLIGKAMLLAKERCKREGVKFTEWKKEHGFSNATASRYMRLHSKCQSEEELQRLKEIGPLQAYIEAGIEAPRPHTPRKSSAKRSQTGASRGEKSKLPPWALPDATDDSESSQNDADQFVEMWPCGQSLAEELRKAIPWQLTLVKKRVSFLLEQDTAALRAAWPKKKCLRTRIAADIDALLELLPRLAATLREDSGTRSIAASAGDRKRRKQSRSAA